MTVASETYEIEYAGNGATLAFAIPFNFLSNSDIEVSQRDSTGDSTVLSTGYAITGAGTGSGTCTFTTAPASGYTIRIERKPQILQPMDLVSNDSFPAETVEAAHDRHAYIAQYLRALIERCIQAPAGDAAIGDMELAPVSTRASTILGFDSAGNLDYLTSIGSTVLSQAVIGGYLYPRTAAEISASVTPTSYAYRPGDVRRYGADPTAASDSTTAIQAADNVGAVSGQPVTFPEGTFKCLTGITKKAVNWIGAGRDKTIIAYYGSGGVLVNMTGTNPARITCTIQDLTLDGTNATGAAEGITLGWNMRSTPLHRVKVYNFPHYGIHFNDQNWIIALRDVLVDTCGRSTTNSAGIFKDAAVDSSTWNEIVFDNVVVEACGSSSSAAGGWNIKTTTANRGVYLVNCGAEGNLGTDEAYFQNLGDLQIVNFYMERESVAGQVVGLDLEGCSGSIFGGFISAAGAANERGLRAVNCMLSIDGANFGFWATSNLDLQSSSVHFGRNWTGQTGSVAPLLLTNIALTDNCQLTGLICPKVSAHKNGTNQTGITTATFTKVTFGTEVFDTTGAFASSTFTPIALGAYQIDAQVTWVAGTDQDRPIIAVYLNGSIYKSNISQNSGTGAYATAISCIVPIANVTDTVEIYVRQTSGVNQDISGSATDTWFMATHVGQYV